MTAKQKIAAFTIGLGVAAIAGVLSPLSGREEWKRYQHEYNRLSLAAGDPPVQIGIRSVRGPRGEERCITCHMGMVLPRSFHPPFQSHPPTGCKMPMQMMGCISCHRGERLAIGSADAHGLGCCAESPLLDWKAGSVAARREKLQAGCATCHHSFEEGVLEYDEHIVPSVAEGMKIFLSQGCPSCHRIEGIYNWAEKGPGLGRAGLRRDAAQLEALLRSPQAPFPASPMPPVRLARREMEKLVLFLLAQTGQRSWDQPPGPPSPLRFRKPINISMHFPSLQLPTEPERSFGREWTGKLGCLGCHTTEEGGAGVPDLRFEGWVRRREYLRSVLENPEKEVFGTHMPPLDVPAVLRESIVEYLYFQRSPVPDSPEGVYLEICSRCHAAKRDPGVVVLAHPPPLIEKGKITLSEKDFISVLAGGRNGTAMAPWGRTLPQSLVKSLYAWLSAK